MGVVQCFREPRENSTPLSRTQSSNAAVCLTAALAVLVAGVAWADDDWTPVRSFRLFPRSLWRGLPQSTVGSLAQDTNGVLWIGTFDGLASFDGQDLEPVAPAPNAPVRGVLTAMVALQKGGIAVTSSGAKESTWFIWLCGSGRTGMHSRAPGTIARMTSSNRPMEWLHTSRPCAS